MKQIVICTNPARDVRFAVTRQLCALLRAGGAEPFVCVLSAAPFPETVPEDLPACTTGEGFADAELAISVGGDGTLLHTARHASDAGIPVLGVNMGTKGFLTEIERNALTDVRRVLEGNFELDRRMMLDVRLERDGETVFSDFALNDAMVGGIGRVVPLTVYGDGGRILTFSGDGVVVATPTGSTAYSMSAGGPIVEPGAAAILVTPVCPHALIAKPCVLAPERLVTVELCALEGRSAYMSVDGGESVPLSGNDRIRISRSARETCLVQLYDQSFYERVSERLGASM